MLNCVIIDDEPLPIELLQNYVAKIPFLKLVNSFNDALAGSAFIRQANNIDLIFLDIQMPHINGIQLLKSLEKPPLVIFTTAYDQYAVNGFELNAIDFLLKPIDFGRFEKAVNKAKDFYHFSSKQKNDDEKFIFVKSDYQVVKINVADIEYIEGLDSYVKIYTGGDKPILSLMSLKAVLEMLPVNAFLRIHRSFIVPIAKIQSIRNKNIRINGKEIPIGTTYQEEVNDWLQKNQTPINSPQTPITSAEKDRIDNFTETKALISKNNSTIQHMRIKKNIASSESGFLFNPSTGDSFSANGVASDIILWMKEGKSVEQTKASILEKYNVEKSQLDKDFDDLYTQLRDNNLLELD